jgi:hypothetical protein
MGGTVLVVPHDNHFVRYDFMRSTIAAVAIAAVSGAVAYHHPTGLVGFAANRAADLSTAMDCTKVVTATASVDAVEGVFVVTDSEEAAPAAEAGAGEAGGGGEGVAAEGVEGAEGV